jgi:azurin
MAPTPIRETAEGIDLSPRVQKSTTVAASPALAAETVVCSVTLVGDIAVTLGTWVNGYVALTVGASGTDVTVKLRRTGTSGTTVVSSGVLSAPAAGEVVAFAIQGFDTGTVMPGQVYVLTVTVANGAAESTVSACSLVAVVV